MKHSAQDRLALLILLRSEPPALVTVFVLLVLGSPEPRVPVRLWAAARLSAAERYEGGAHMRAAAYVDKLLKRAKAADLPVEQSMPGELVINRKTA